MTTRADRILSPRITKAMRGIEIGPWHAPLCPKREGWSVLINDVLPVDDLRQRAAADPNIPASGAEMIEEVDLVGPAHRLDKLTEERSFDFIVSSHNFEHLPNPVSFLQAAQVVLRPGGVLTMAVPDKRRIFDRFRPRSTLGDVVEAYRQDAERPSGRQVFDFSTHHTADGRSAARDLKAQHGLWVQNDDTYRDVHCWAFTPMSFTSIVHDLRFLNFIALDLEDVVSAGFEFYAHLRKPSAPTQGYFSDESFHYARRDRLFADMLKEDRE